MYLSTHIVNNSFEGKFQMLRIWYLVKYVLENDQSLGNVIEFSSGVDIPMEVVSMHFSTLLLLCAGFDSVMDLTQRK
jgi:hypothetical protein